MSLMNSEKYVRTQKKSSTKFLKKFHQLLKDVGIEVGIPRLAGRQIHRNNVQAETLEEYYRISISFRSWITSSLSLVIASMHSILSNCNCRNCCHSMSQWRNQQIELCKQPYCIKMISSSQWWWSRSKCNLG